MHEIAKSLHYENQSLQDLLIAIQENIQTHSSSLPPQERKYPGSIVESRLTSAQEAYSAGMNSCGTMAAITAEMLRTLGYSVKLIHGETAGSVDHAWIEVLDPVSGEWTAYDPTLQDLRVPGTHTKKLEAHSWHDIKEQIISDDKTMMERRKKRGIS
jgi:hypothetical protein